MFLDTSGLLCLLHRGTQHHELAKTAYFEHRIRVTSNYVVAELVALASARGFPRAPVLDFCQGLERTSDVELIWIERTTHDAAMDLLAARQDKAYSLCDATSFVIMRQRRLSQALTTDRHFEQEGFVRLLAPPK